MKKSSWEIFLRVSFTDQSRFGEGVESLEMRKLNSEAASICIWAQRPRQEANDFWVSDYDWFSGRRDLYVNVSLAG